MGRYPALPALSQRIWLPRWRHVQTVASPKWERDNHREKAYGVGKRQTQGDKLGSGEETNTERQTRKWGIDKHGETA